MGERGSLLHTRIQLFKGDIRVQARLEPGAKIWPLTRAFYSERTNKIVELMADLLDANEIKQGLKRVPEWELEKKTIERTF